MSTSAGLPTDAEVARFRRDGHLLVRGLLDPTVLGPVREALQEVVEASGRLDHSLADAEDAYSRAFVQVVNPSAQAPAVTALTRSPLLGRWVAALLDAPGTRVMLEDLFLKPPGAGPTPWHQDASVAPIDPTAMCTAWVALDPVGPESGGLRMVTGSHDHGLLGPVDITEHSQEVFEAMIEDRGWSVVDRPAMRPGDVSFHSGLLIHGAFANDSDGPRMAMALHCFADGTCVPPVRSPGQQRLLDMMGPGLAPGDPAASPMWPPIHLGGGDP